MDFHEFLVLLILSLFSRRPRSSFVLAAWMELGLDNSYWAIVLGGDDLR